ncbi:hypothetical protein GCM10023318_32080 [Nocardia callitridis]|uniref:Uncharacterized protein n=1 Tax=Nocardia callitridis TaxID=648753 RepID=A0ABP9KEK4_9NOCA
MSDEGGDVRPGDEPDRENPSSGEGTRFDAPERTRRSAGERESDEETTTERSGSVAGAEPDSGTVGTDDTSAGRNEGQVSSVESSDNTSSRGDEPADREFEQFRGDLDAVERRVAGEIDPGMRALVVAGAVFVLLLSLVLPHAGAARGFDVLVNSDAARFEHIGLPSRVFVWFLVVFGIGFSTLALTTRRWVLAWIAVAGTAITGAFGVFSIWHRQTPGLGNYQGAGPGIGLILGALAAMVLTFHWVRVVWSRTAVQLAAEAQRRDAAVAAEERDRRRLTGE